MSTRGLWFLLILVLAGCQTVSGPQARAVKPQRIDAVGLPTSEQQMRGRDRLAMPDMSFQAGPRTYFDLPGPTGR